MQRERAFKSSDKVLELKIRSLHANRPRYYETVSRYFEERTRNGVPNSFQEMYESASRMINRLWKGSGKDPATFKSADRFESLLREIPNYRDHRIHSSNVFLLGYYIINRIKTIDPEFSFSSNDPNLTWMLAATFHDVGYAIQETEFWLNRVFEEFLGVNPKFSIGIPQVMPMIYLDFMRILSAYHEGGITSTSQDLPTSGIDWVFYNECSSKLMEKNHGIIGALMLAHLLGIKQKFLGKKNKWDFKYNHLPACHAIATHMLPSIKVRFAIHPFAALLIVCDEVQDWGRSITGRESDDTVCLVDVNVLESKPIEIQLKMSSSKKRQSELKKTITGRLQVDERVKLSFLDQDGEPFLSAAKKST
jgi:hypothetical protein